MATPIELRYKMREILKQPVGSMGVEGLTLAGIAHLIETVGESHNMQKDVEKFHERFLIIGNQRPAMLESDLQYFRTKRLHEEVDEHATAKSLPEKLDALIDLLYVTYGTIYLHGFSQEIVEEAWKRVHKANMKKVRATAANPGKYGELKYDIVKPPNWVAPNLNDLVE